MAEQLTPNEEQQLERLLNVGLTRVQAERHLAYERGDDISDVVSVKVVKPPKPD